MGQMDVWEEDIPAPDEALIEMGGSPLRGDGGAHGPGRGSVGAMIGQWKSRVTKRLWKFPQWKGHPIWQRNYYEHIIRNEAEHERIDRYIAGNPANWHLDDENPGKSR
jgi:hypothetical protein